LAIAHQFDGKLRRRFINEGTEPGRFHGYFYLSCQCVAQNRLSHWAAADIAHANDEYVPDHYRFSGTQLVLVM
jgi:hypothetical protein